MPTARSTLPPPRAQGQERGAFLPPSAKPQSESSVALEEPSQRHPGTKAPRARRGTAEVGTGAQPQRAKGPKKLQGEASGQEKHRKFQVSKEAVNRAAHGRDEEAGTSKGPRGVGALQVMSGEQVPGDGASEASEHSSF